MQSSLHPRAGVIFSFSEKSAQPLSFFADLIVLIFPFFVFVAHLPLSLAAFFSAEVLEADAAAGAFFQLQALGVVEALRAFRNFRDPFFPAFHRLLVEAIPVDVADEFAFAEMLAQADFSAGEDGDGLAAVSHAEIGLRPLPDAAPESQTCSSDLPVQPDHGPVPQLPFLIGVDVRHGPVPVEEVVGIDRQPIAAAEPCRQILHQCQQVLRVVHIHVQTDGHGHAPVQQAANVRHHHLVGTAAAVNEGLDLVVHRLRAVQGDLHPLQVPVFHGIFHGFFVEKIPVGNGPGGKFHALFPQVGADNVDDGLVKQRLAAEPVDLHLLAAAVGGDVFGHLVGGFLRHGHPGPAQLEAVKAAGVAVGGGENGVAGDGRVLFLLVCQNPPYQIGVLLVLAVLGNDEPVGFQILAVKPPLPLGFGEQNHLPGQKIEQKVAVFDWDFQAVMEEAGVGAGGEETGENFDDGFIVGGYEFHKMLFPCCILDFLHSYGNKFLSGYILGNSLSLKNIAINPSPYHFQHLQSLREVQKVLQLLQIVSVSRWE